MVRQWLKRALRAPPVPADEHEVELAPVRSPGREGSLWLQFQPELEADFHRGFMRVNAARIRVAHLMAVLSVLGFMVMDRLWAQGFTPPLALWLLSTVSIPALLVPLFATYQAQRKRPLQGYSFIATLVLGLSLVWVVYLGGKVNAWYPWESILLVTVYVYFVSGLLWRQTLICGGAIWLAFFATQLMLAVPDSLALKQLPYSALYLLIANFIGSIGRYVFEWQERQAYLMQRELRHLADHDALCDVYNRRAFNLHAQTAWALAARERKCVALMLLDLDYFKRLNDRHGHIVGDRYLEAMGASLRELTRRPLDAAGRFGGDEFVAIWYDVNAEFAAGIEQQLKKSLLARVWGLPEEDGIGFSGGLVLLSPDTGLGFSEAQARADELLYEAKRRGRGHLLWANLLPSPADQDEQLTARRA